MCTHLIHASLGPTTSTCQMAFQLVQPFLHTSWQRVILLYNSPLKIDSFAWGHLDPHLTHGCLGPPKSKTQMTSLSAQPLLQSSPLWQSDRLTDGQTDHAIQSVTTGRIYTVLQCCLEIKWLHTHTINFCLTNFVLRIARAGLHPKTELHYHLHQLSDASISEREALRKPGSLPISWPTVPMYQMAKLRFQLKNITHWTSSFLDPSTHSVVPVS